jgi:hypothetical protein
MMMRIRGPKLITRRTLLWAIVIWVCLSLPALRSVAYSFLPARTAGWNGLRAAVLAADARYGEVTLGGVRMWTEIFSFSASGETFEHHINDWFTVWRGGPEDGPSLPATADQYSLIETVTVGGFSLRAMLKTASAAPGSRDAEVAEAESRWRILEPAIRDSLESIRVMPSLRLIRNDIRILNSWMSMPGAPLEVYLVPQYVGFVIGLIPGYLLGLIILVLPANKVAVYGMIVALAGAILWAAITTELQHRRQRSRPANTQV